MTIYHSLKILCTGFFFVVLSTSRLSAPNVYRKQILATTKSSVQKATYFDNFSSRYFRYPNIPADLQVHVVSSAKVQDICRRDSRGRLIPTYDDKGQLIDDTRVILGCYGSQENTIWVDEDYPEVLYHELCHASGMPELACSKIRLYLVNYIGI